MKILTLGCSFTYGSELPDCTTDNFPECDQPSALAWPCLLAARLNATVDNLAKPGGSNARMYRLAMDQASRETYDLVVVAWTDHSRLDLQYRNRDYPCTAHSTGVHARFPWIKDYYAEHHSDSHSWQRWLTEVIGLQSWFQQREQQYRFLSFQEILWGPEVRQYPHLLAQVDADRYIGWRENHGMTEFMGDCPKGPGGHPLELGHQRIAEHIYEHIRN